MEDVTRDIQTFVEIYQKLVTVYPEMARRSYQDDYSINEENI